VTAALLQQQPINQCSQHTTCCRTAEHQLSPCTTAPPPAKPKSAYHCTISMYQQSSTKTQHENIVIGPPHTELRMQTELASPYVLPAQLQHCGTLQAFEGVADQWRARQQEQAHRDAAALCCCSTLAAHLFAPLLLQQACAKDAAACWALAAPCP
jgi:hypothetical protein